MFDLSDAEKTLLKHFLPDWDEAVLRRHLIDVGDGYEMAVRRAFIIPERYTPKFVSALRVVCYSLAEKKISRPSKVIDNIIKAYNIVWQIFRRWQPSTLLITRRHLSFLIFNSSEVRKIE